MGAGDSESSFSVGSGGSLGMDRRLPNLKQVGVWTESETVWPNWPHHHHPEDSRSAMNLESNLRLVEELEEKSKGQRKDKTEVVVEDKGEEEEGSRQLK